MKEFHAELIYANEANIAFESFMEFLEALKIKVPLNLLEPLIVVARHNTSSDYAEKLDGISEQLLAIAKE